MYAAIRRYDGIEPGAVREFVRRVTADAGASATVVEADLDRWAAEGGFVPPISETPGFEAYYLVDAGNGVVVSISLFSERARADESNRGAAEWVRHNLADIVQRPPEVLTGEVVAHRAAGETPLA
jgi:hypothetical protein